jgi:hypothetical protein
MVESVATHKIQKESGYYASSLSRLPRIHLDYQSTCGRESTLKLFGSKSSSTARFYPSITQGLNGKLPKSPATTEFVAELAKSKKSNAAQRKSSSAAMNPAGVCARPS